MKTDDTTALHLRLDLLGYVVAAMARSLTPQDAVRASASIREEARDMLDGQPVSERAEDSILRDLTRILNALNRPAAVLSGATETAY
jgi:hypothetical protein